MMLKLSLVTILATGLIACRDAAPDKPIERQPLYYQSSMHPWVKSDKPGKCTVCGMPLTPVYEEGNDPIELVELSEESIRVMGLQTSVVTNHDLELRYPVSGQIRPARDREHIVTARAAGWITRIDVRDVGAQVSHGQALYSMYSPEIYQTEREYTLLYRQSLMKHSDLLAREHNRLVDNLAIRLSEYGLTRKQIAAIPSKSPKNTTNQFLAPVSGQVINLKVSHGERVEKGQPLMAVADLLEVWFEFPLSERLLKHVKAGQGVSFRVPSAGDENRAGRITFIDPTIDPGSRSAMARVVIQNPEIRIQGRRERILEPGQYVEGEIKTSLGTALAVPNTAVLSTGSAESFLFIAEGAGTFRKQRVRLGQRGSQHVEILDGVAAGMRVATRGQMLLEGEEQMAGRTAGAGKL